MHCILPIKTLHNQNNNNKKNQSTLILFATVSVSQQITPGKAHEQPCTHREEEDLTCTISQPLGWEAQQQLGVHDLPNPSAWH